MGIGDEYAEKDARELRNLERDDGTRTKRPTRNVTAEDLGLTNPSPEKLEILKQNAIRMADHHRKHCDGPTCDISLWWLAEMAHLAGIEFSDEEHRKFV